MVQYDDVREPASSIRSSVWQPIDIDPDIHIPARRSPAADGGRTRAFSWRNWFAHGA